ncbi:DUF2442 domain-containing protein (plasmid) [Deinococcus sp. KNUC1210]|uniref:DUF2442 domain-containing protein n=1 Tax=Deinococcus sp. KNUC1210 TaxID=2917691 RepID=UPI001EF13F6C|nr:DUF2442 domain-containing protein [Deinococcus sp. KNUC1210]ULH17451.1 DUF2442 domain-containing protein [Deinococcus sp. KNUC1210]
MYRLTDVRPGDGLTLHLTYTDGATVHADVAGLLAGDPGVFAPLAARSFFEQVALGPRGRSITWPGELDLDADVFRLDDGDPAKPDVFRTLSSTAATPPDPVSSALRQAVEASGLTQAEVARRADMKQPNLATLLDPTYHGHSLSAVRRVADALGLQVQVTLVSSEQAAS